MPEQTDLRVGDKVKKVSGDYHPEGVVIARFETLSGKVRFVVEHAPLMPGLLHIYSANNLEKIE